MSAIPRRGAPIAPRRLDSVRRRLLARRRELEGALDGVRVAPPGVEDEADQANTTLERELSGQISNVVVDSLGDIDRALERIADGSYGICQDCGLPIPAERLLLLPATPLCVHCKAREERMQPGPDEAQPRGVSQDHGLSLGESRSAVQ